MSACPSCGLESLPEATFCSRCGTRLAVAAVAADERKVVTTLFCDLVGFTAMSEAADPEEVDAVLRSYSDAARRAIERHGGTVEKFIGDAVVGVFGVPVLREDDARRAVGAGLDVIRAMDGLRRPDGSPLQARVGINTGRVLLRGDVAPESGEGFLVGDAVNTAARLQSAAPPMGVVVGARTHTLTSATFAYDELAPLTLKGKSGRVEAWLVKGRAAEREGSAGVRSSLVGREAELAACTAALDRLAEGQGGLLLVTGEAGIGKTRLVEELCRAAHERGCDWLEGRTLSFGRSISYWPFLEILDRDCGIESDDGEEARSEKLAARVAGLFGDEGDEVLPFLLTLLSLPIPEDLADRVRYADGEAMGRQLYRAMRLYTARRAGERPLVLVFEDLHWMDESSAALLEHLLPLVGELPLLVVGVSRPEMDTPLARLREVALNEYARQATEIAVPPLTADSSAVLVRNLTALGVLPESLSGAIQAKTEGNPFFIEEIVRSLIDQGGLAPAADGGYRLTDEVARIAIPDTLLGVIMARVDRLDDELKQVLRLASVIGRSFFYRLLAALSEADRTLDEGLAGLEARELVLEKARDPELEYIFKHALVQEATYESILLQRRRDLHRRVAESIEMLFGGRLEDFYGMLSYHYTKAEEWKKAQEYLFKAGDQAGTIAADAEALKHYEQALTAYDLAYGAQLEPLDLARVLRRMGEACARRGDDMRAREYLGRALAVLGHPYPAGRGAVRRALIGQVLRQLGHLVWRWRHPRQPAAQAHAVAGERCWCYYTLALADVGGDQAGLLLALLLGLNVGEAAGLDWAVAGFASVAGYVCDLAHLPRLARHYHRRTLEIAERTELPLALAHAYFFGGMHEAWATGDAAKAVDYLSRGRDRLRALGVTRNWAFASEVLGSTLVSEGEFDRAQGIAEELLTYGGETGDQVAVAFGHLLAGRVRGLRGALADGERDIRHGVGILLAAAQPALALTGSGILAENLLCQGKVEDAGALLREAAARAAGLGTRGALLRMFAEAEAAQRLAAVERALGGQRPAALREAKHACRGLWAVARSDAQAVPSAARLMGRNESLRGRSRRAVNWWRKSLDAGERLGAHYEVALTRLEMGRLTGDRALTDRALAECAAIGARSAAASARDLTDASQGQPLLAD